MKARVVSPLNRQRGWRLAVKRAVDIGVAGTGLLVAMPVLAGTAASIGVTMGRPILFEQRRPGRHARPFIIRKFRTMTNERDANGALLPDHQRLTVVGRFIRSTSLDEVPQLWNVLIGEMSLVGPRPLLMHYLDRYTPAQQRRHDVLPGITGWAQVNGRNDLSWDEKFAFDAWYAAHWSLALDAEVLIRTAFGVLRRDGISSEGHVTMPEFLGTPISGTV